MHVHCNLILGLYHLFPDQHAGALTIHNDRVISLCPTIFQLNSAYLEVMINRVFGPSAIFACDKLQAAEKSGTSVNIEAVFSQLTLDIIGKAVFNYDFNSLTTDSPLIQVRVLALRYLLLYGMGTHHNGVDMVTFKQKLILRLFTSCSI